VDAAQWTGDNSDEVEKFCGPENFDYYDGETSVLTYVHSTWDELTEGDWVLRLPGGLKIVDHEEFQRDYEEIQE
jgi:hypothetical protein